MNMKCLIEVLKEKKYIKEVDQLCLGQKPCILTLETKYDVVIQKIMKSIDDDYFAYHESKYRIDVVDLRILKEWLKKNCLNEINPINSIEYALDDFVTIKSHPSALEGAINDYIPDYKADLTINRKIINLKIKQKRLDEEARKEKEVFDFINSLP